jgi:prepilin-type N-terminal cleavage/methylation domain-containing protein
MKAQGGLSLTEVLIALALLGLLGAIGAPYLLASLPHYRVKAATRHVLGDLRLARTLAAERGFDALVAFHCDGPNTYRLGLDTHPAPPANGDGVLTGDDVLIKVVDLSALYSGTGFSSSDPDIETDGITFTGNTAKWTPQATSNGGTVYLQPLCDFGARRDRDRKITVMSSTGRARAFSWTGTQWE